MRGQWNERRRQGFRATHFNFFEAASENPDEAEVWCYTDQISYAPGDTVSFHCSTSAAKIDLRIYHDTNPPQKVHCATIPGQRHATPEDSYARGCDWPSAYRWTLPENLSSGAYLVVSTIALEGGETLDQHHLFIVRPASEPTAPLLMVCCTSTWIAYNCWGGANSYEGLHNGIDDNCFSPQLHIHRPWERGQVWLPEGAPRIPVNGTQRIGSAPRYPNLEFAFANGFAKYYAAAGWASYERHFATWAENNGIALDMICQHDLQFHPELLANYPALVIVGHDEYWSGEMRDAIDNYVDGGGNVARFGANFFWQVRLENDGLTQVCYKHPATAARPALYTDPLLETNPKRVSGCWDLPCIERPAAETFGLSGARGIYAKLGGASPNNAGGFQVFRPQHWAFENTDVYYGDIFGNSATIFGYEVDGIDYSFENGLPVPTENSGAPAGMEILAMGFAATFEEDHDNPGGYLYAGDGDLQIISEVLHGENPTTADREAAQYGSGMIAHFRRGKGQVFNAASCEWVNGLRLREPVTETITRNVLARFCQGQDAGE